MNPMAYWKGVSVDPQTGRVNLLTLQLLHSQAEVTIDIYPKHQLAGDTPAPQEIRNQLEMLRDALNQVVATPGAILTGLPPSALSKDSQ